MGSTGLLGNISKLDPEDERLTHNIKVYLSNRGKVLAQAIHRKTPMTLLRDCFLRKVFLRFAQTGMVVYAFNPRTRGRDRQIPELKASLI